MIEGKRYLSKYYLIFLLLLSCILPIFQFNYDFSSNAQDYLNFPSSSAQRSVTSQWIKNPTFEAPIEPTWYWENGTDGDNSDMDATTSTGQANYDVLGETRTFTVVSGIINSSSSPNWKQFQNDGFQYPDTAEIRSYGAYVSHEWTDDTNQAPSVHWKTNISIPIDMSDYIITSASLEVIVNASVNSNVDTPNDVDSWEFFSIGDSVTFYSQISDLDYNPPIYTVASNKTKYLGQQNFGQPTILTLNDSPLNTVDEIDLITALTSAFDKDPSHSNFTLTLGIDIYSEDNFGGTDTDTFSDLIIKTCNLTFTVKKKIDQSTTLSWNQVGNTLDSASVQVTDAKFFFRYKINNTWPSSSPLSEIIFSIDDKSYDEGIIKLSSATTSWQDAKVGGFDVTSLISTDINITVSIEVFLKDTFELGEGYSISIDEVYLNISYIETFPDYGTDLELFLDGDDKTLDPVIQIPIDNMLNVTVTYKDNVSANHISADSATLEGKVSGDFTEIPALEQYYFDVNSSELGLGISILTVTIQKVNYEAQSIQIFIQVIERETKLDLEIDTVPISNNQTINVRFNELLDFRVSYEDNLTSTFVDDASVELVGFGGMTKILNEYNFTLNTNNLKEGVNVLTVFAQKINYQSQSIQVYVNVVERATQIKLVIDGNEMAGGATINSQFDELINITIFYLDDLTSLYIENSSVNLLGFGSMNETLNQYNFTLDTNDLVQGGNLLNIFAQKANYQFQSIQFFINVQIRSTYLEFYIDGNPENDSVTIDTQFDLALNITVFFRDVNTDAHLAGADVDLLGVGNFDEIGVQFNYTILTNSLVKGINILTVFAQLAGYQPQTIRFFINVEERETDLYLFINDIRRYQGNTVQFEANEIVNITVFYKDNFTDTHLSGANVELLGFGSMNETLNQYNFTLNTNDLEGGINILTIFAQLANYQPDSVQFFIEVIDRYTELEIYLNGNMTTDPVLEIPIGTVVNITIKFYDLKTGLEIPSALVQLIGESIFKNLTENLVFNQYSIILNNLSLDLKLFTIVAQAPTYQVNTSDIRIMVNPVSTSINTLSGLTSVDINPNDDFRIQIVLNNIDFGGTVKNATVTYRWDNGQGTLTDSNNDGIYEVTLLSVPARSQPYVITINAYAGENYEFQSDFEIVLNVEVPPGLEPGVITIVIISLVAGLVGITTAFILYQKHFKYPPKVRLMRKVRKKIGKGKNIKPLAVSSRDSIISDELEHNREILKVEKEIVDKINKKLGGDTLE